MKFEITTSPKNVEMANYILAQAINSLRDNPEKLDVSLAELESAERFRKSVLKGWLKPKTTTK